MVEHISSLPTDAVLWDEVLTSLCRLQEVLPDAVLVGGTASALYAEHLAGFTGFLQADGYVGYEALYDPARTKPGPITEVACWAHCRRKFFDVWESKKSTVAKEAIDRIAAFYAIEAKARFAHRTNGWRTAPRRRRSSPRSSTGRKQRC